MRVTERHVSGDRLHVRPKVGDPLRQPLELPAGLDLLVEMCGAECLQLDDLGLELHSSQYIGIAGYQCFGLGSRENNFVNVLDDPDGNRTAQDGLEAARLGLDRLDGSAI
jgi:hypothetical protein